MSNPITPPPELVTSWIECDEGGPDVIRRIATRAAQWGANQELEACCKWLESEPDPGHVDLLRSCATALRAARRPKPLSLAEEALALVALIQGNKKMWQIEQLDVVRRALERLQELEGK